MDAPELGMPIDGKSLLPILMGENIFTIGNGSFLSAGEFFSCELFGENNSWCNGRLKYLGVPNKSINYLA